MEAISRVHNQRQNTPIKEKTKAAQSSSPEPKQFGDAESACKHVQQYMKELNALAKDYEEKNGEKPKDQDFPVEVIKMVPPRPTAPPVLVVGGMGPLAGAQAMDAALKKFGDTREIVLVQLCDTPDRTGALKKDSECGGISEEHVKVVEALAKGFEMAQGHLSTTHLGNAHMVVACNTAHNFVPDAFAKYKQEGGHSAVIDFDSLVECVSARLKNEKKPVLILGTDGTRKTRLYTNPLEAEGVNCVNLGDDDQDVLMNAIYEGVKAFNPSATMKYGEQLLKNLKESGQIKSEQGCIILSACTEVPEMLNVLKEGASTDARKMLAGVEVVDPVAVTLQHISDVDARRAAEANAGTLVSLGAKV